MRLPFRGKQARLLLGTFSPHWSPFSTFGLSEPEQHYHGLIVGKSGAGKSKLLHSIALSYIQRSFAHNVNSAYSSHGVTVLDPHHDLAFGILKSLVAAGFYRKHPEQAYAKVLYLDFGNNHYLPLNILEGEGASHDRARKILDGAYRIWPELMEAAPRFTRFFECGVALLMENRLPIVFLRRLYSDQAFRQQCLRRIPHDEEIQLTFHDLDQLERDQLEQIDSLVTRAHQLNFSDKTKLCFGQPECALRFRQFMDEGRFLLLNLGRVNDYLTRKILGAMLMVMIEQGAFSRTDFDESRRPQHTVIVDEWPVFAASEFTLQQILSQSRKFGLNIYLACQSLGQISAKRLDAAFENCGLGVYFRLGQSSAELSSEQISEFDPYQIKPTHADPYQGNPLGLGLKEKDLRSPVTHDQYLSAADQVKLWTDELKKLSSRMCYIKVDPKPAVRIKTNLVPPAQVDQGELDEVLAEYRRRYQLSQADAQQSMGQLRVLDLPEDRTLTPSRQPSALAW